MHRRDLLASLGLAAVGGSAGTAAEQPSPAASRLKGVPAVTVAELAEALRTEGFQWRFIGRQIEFTAVVLTAGPAPRMQIKGLERGKLDTAVLHRGGAENSVKAGQTVTVRGLIVDQWYGVWQVWLYGWSIIDA